MGVYKRYKNTDVVCHGIPYYATKIWSDAKMIFGSKNVSGSHHLAVGVYFWWWWQKIGVVLVLVNILAGAPVMFQEGVFRQEEARTAVGSS